MYHLRFRGTHYDMGRKWGAQLFECGTLLPDNVPFFISRERIRFAEECRLFYEEWYPEILEEIRGIADGQRAEARIFEAVLLSMYCIMPENKCSCFAFRDGERVILARNSDFLTELEKLYMNCIYRPVSSYAFQGNTTAFTEMEDGVNEHGLAIGLTSVHPKELGFGLNAGMLLRYGLEKCRSVEEFVRALEKMPIASSQTFTAADRTGTAAVIECNPRRMEVRFADEDNPFVLAVNAFHLPGMRKYQAEGIDDWNAKERYEKIKRAFGERKSGEERSGACGRGKDECGMCKRREDKCGKDGRGRNGAGIAAAGEDEAVSFAMDVLKGKYGFLCQYDRSTGKDTVWSVVYDVGQGRVYRCEGNPSRRRFAEDKRFR